MKKIVLLICAAALVLSGCESVEKASASASSAAESTLIQTTAETTVIQTASEMTEPDWEENTETFAFEIEEEPPEPTFSSAKLVFAGDNLIHTPIYRQAKERSSDGSYYDFELAYKEVAPYIEEADLAVLNQETIITDEFEPSTYPSFCSPTDLATEMLKIGFDAFSISNNHVLDKGEAGLLATLSFWKTEHPNVPVYGAYESEADMNNIRVLEINGIKFAFLGYMEHTNGLSLPKNSECRVTYTSQEELIKEQVKKAAEISDCVIVSVHFGIEVSNIITDFQREFSRKLADWGADIIVGTQPHTIQSMEYIDKSDGEKAFVFYCLGNFISAMDNPYSMVEYLGRITVTKNNETGEIELSEPNAVPLINQYDIYFNDIRAIPFSVYTPELGAAHGCKGADYAFFEKVIEDNIPAEYLSE